MYVFNTWLLANLFHPVVMLFYYKGEGIQVRTELVWLYCWSFFISILFSVPALIIAALVSRLIRKMEADGFAAFLTWLFLVTSIPFITILLIFLMFFNDGIPFAEFSVIIPATISVFAAVAIRFKQFLKFFERRVALETDTLSDNA